MLRVSYVRNPDMNDPAVIVRTFAIMLNGFWLQVRCTNWYKLSFRWGKTMSYEERRDLIAGAVLKTQAKQHGVTVDVNEEIAAIYRRDADHVYFEGITNTQWRDDTLRYLVEKDRE